MVSVNKIAINLWFDNQAEEAAKFYTGIFKNSKIGRVSYYGKEGFEIHGMAEGTILTVEFELEGQQFIGLNGGPVFNFNESVSFVINCETQEEIDYYWKSLGENGDENAQQCGWLKDKFGISWQVVPTMLADLISGKPTEKSEKVMKVMLQMKKLEIATLLSAANN